MSRGVLSEARPVVRWTEHEVMEVATRRSRAAQSSGDDAIGMHPRVGDRRAIAVAASSSETARNVRRSRCAATLGWVWTVFGPFLGLVLITVLFAVLTRESGQFLTLYNWRTIAVQTVIVGTAALGMTIIMIAGGIDLSVGSTVALVTVCIALFVKKVDPVLPESLRAWKLVLPVALMLGVALGGLCGAINGALDRRPARRAVHRHAGDLHRSIADWPRGWRRARRCTCPATSKPWWFGQIMKIEPEPRWLLVAPGVWVLLVLSILLALALRYSLLGRYVYAIGSNEATARLCGINVPAHQGRSSTRSAAWRPAWPASCSSPTSAAIGRPDHRRRARAPGHRRGRHRRRQLERRRGDRPRHPDRLPDHVGAEQRLRPRRNPQRQPGHHHRHHHHRRRHARPASAQDAE